MRSTFLRLLTVIGIAGLGVAIAALLLTAPANTLVRAGNSTGRPLELDALPERSQVFDSKGRLVATLHAEQNRSPVKLERVSRRAVKTILAVEDEHFYAHRGLNLRATIRALFENVQAGEVQQGGSTITMQVVKTSLLTPERDLARKTREALLALRLEDDMSKDEILERYLNTVYLGNGAYGLQAAAEVYFGKDASQLGWAEAALLAGLIRNPSGYDPFRNPKVALERRRISLQRLVEVGELTQAQADNLALTPLPSEPHEVVPPPKDYFVEEVKQQILKDPMFGDTYGERYNAVFQGGLRIYTTLDRDLQQAALDARAGVLPGDGRGTFVNPSVRPADCKADPAVAEKAGIGVYDMVGKVPCLVDDAGRLHALGTASIVSVEPSSGAVRAMVGGPGFERFKFNLATKQPGRQTGSSFKTYVLLAALENGIVPDDTIDGFGPCSFSNPKGTPNPYVAKNFGNDRGRAATVLQQTLKSSNCAFLRLGQVVGLDKVVDMARRLGVNSPLATQLSLPIGAYEVSPLEHTAAYAAIPNDGVFNPPYLIDKVEDSDGRVLYQHKDESVRAFSSQSARLAAQVLQRNVEAGTGRRAALPGRPVAGKTGTAQDSADAWFMGFTPQLATGIWMGVPEARVPMRGVGGITVVGGSFPAQIWGRYMAAALEGEPAIEFAAPDPTRSGHHLRVAGEVRRSDSPTLRSRQEFRSRNEVRLRTTSTTTAPAATTSPSRRGRPYR